MKVKRSASRMNKIFVPPMNESRCAYDEKEIEQLNKSASNAKLNTISEYLKFALYCF